MTEPRSLRDRFDRALAIVRRAARFYLVAVITVLLGGVIAIGYAFTQARNYRSETLILYREAIRSTALGDEVGGDPATKLGLRLKELVLSRTRLQQIIDEFALYPKIVEERGYVDAVDEMRTHIAFRVRDGDTFGLSFEGDEPHRVQMVTAKLADALIEENSRSRLEQAEVTKEFLDAEEQRTEVELKRKETTLARFLAEHPEFAKETMMTAGTAIRAEQKKAGAGKEPELLALEREAWRLEQELGTAGRSPRGAASIVEDRAVSEAGSDLRAAQKDLAERQAQFTEQHPDVRTARARVTAAEDKLRRAIATVPVAAPVPGREEPGGEPRNPVAMELARINAEIVAWKTKKRREDATPEVLGGAGRVIALETEWTRINREVTTARAAHDQLKDRQFKAAMTANSVTGERNAQIKILDAAYLPTHPSKPGRGTLAGLGLLISIGLGWMSALACALLDDRIYDRYDVERLAVAPLLVVVPRAQLSWKASHG